MTASFQDLRYFRAIVTHGSLRAAGDAMDVSQPALSKCLRRLEDVYGQPLIRFSNGTAIITDVGRIVLQTTDDILYQVDELSRQLKSLNGHVAELRVGAGPFNAEAGCKHALARYMTQAPGARVHLVIAPWDRLLALLREEHLLFYVAEIGDAVLDSSVEVRPIPTRPFRWFCRAGHPLAGAKQADAQMLTQWPIAGPALPTRFFKWMMDVKRLGAGPGQIAPNDPLSVTCDNWSILKHIVRDSDCIGLSTEHGIRAELSNGELVVIDSVVDVPAGQNGAVLRRGGRLSPEAEALLEVVINVLKN